MAGKRYAYLSFSSGVNWKRVNKKLLSNLNRLGASLGQVITVTSGYRDYAKQKALYQRYVNSGYDRRYIAAKPGRSMHERGLAVDAYVGGTALSEAVSARRLSHFGLSAPVPGDANHIQLSGSAGGGSSGPPGLVSWARKQAAKWGVPEGLLLAQINQESGWNANAKSSAGAEGIAQFMPGTWAGLARRYGVQGKSPFDPKTAIMVMARYMGGLIQQYGNLRDPLSVYNSGRPWSVGQGIGQTNAYVNNILAAANSSSPAGTGGSSSGQMGEQAPSVAMTGGSDVVTSSSASDFGALSSAEATIPGILSPGAVPASGSSQQQTSSTWQLLSAQPLVDSETQALYRRVQTAGG